ncbi:MAG: hypothetical protein V4550_06900 [Gemmatimonadota bacterium]
MLIRKLRVATCAAVTALLGCAGESITQIDTRLMAGVYALHEVDGVLLPLTIVDGQGAKHETTQHVIQIEADLSYTTRKTVRITQGSTVRTEVTLGSGSITANGSSLIIRDDHGISSSGTFADVVEIMFEARTHVFWKRCTYQSMYTPACNDWRIHD